MKRWMILAVLIALTACTTPAGSGAPQDLLVSAEQARLTADAAQEIAESQSRYLTATAEAPIIRITETAAAFAMVQAYWTATAQSVMSTETAAMTHTAAAWTATPNATQTAVFAASNAQGTQIAYTLERDRLELERQQKNNEFWRLLPGISFAVVALLAFMFSFVYVRKQRYQPAPVDDRGNILPLIDVVDGQVTDVDRNPNNQGMLHPNIIGRYIEQRLQLPPTVPQITKERQDATTERDQMIDLATRGLPTQKDDGRRKIAEQAVAKQLSEPNMQSRFRLLDGETSDLSVIDAEIITVLDNEWKESQQK